MPVQIVENWSEITGTVMASRDANQPQGFVEIELHVESVRPVEPFPNLLADAEGHGLTVVAPRDLAARAGVSPGVRISCRVRKADRKRVFVDPTHFGLASPR